MSITTVRSLSAICLLALTAAGCRTTRPEYGSVEAQMAAFGTQRSVETGQVGSVSTIDLGDAKYTRVEELIAGRAPGVQVTRTTAGRYSIRIRGNHTLTASDEPLFVVDGIPVSSSSVESTLASINPQDVARIDVLKDAGATSFYGSRGASGVILITTKRGL